MNKLIFDIKTHLGISIRCTEQYWQYIISVKHPALKDRLEDVIQTLKEPDQIRKSKTDANVYLFYKGQNPRWTCAVIKEGEIIWTK
jgi:hypothetical protein